MPEVPLTFRPACGSFTAVFIGFMALRAKKKRAMFLPTLTVRHRSTGVMCVLLLTLLFWGGLLHRCGDVEKNPGPVQGKETRQSRLTSAGKISGSDNVDSPTRQSTSGGKTEHTVNDVMDTLKKMNTDLNAKFDAIQDDVKEVKEDFKVLKREMARMEEEMSSLRKTNKALQVENEKLKTKYENLERRTDDLEDRSKRNNIIVHGIPRTDNETWQNCEDKISEMIVDKLELIKFCDCQFDRVHRVSSKKDCPIVAKCTFFEDKDKILKARDKLKGISIFINEDYSRRVRKIRRNLGPHLKAARDAGKRASMVFDHLLIDDTKLKRIRPAMCSKRKSQFRS